MIPSPHRANRSDTDAESIQDATALKMRPPRATPYAQIVALVVRDVPRIQKAVLRDVQHDLCVVLALHESSFAYVVAHADSGEVIAWDGWYYEDTEPEAVLLADLDWADWDDMPTKLLIKSQSKWATDEMAFWLIPTFSPAREAADLVSTHHDSVTSPEATRGLQNARVVAYLPIVDREVYDARLTSR